MKFVAVIRQVPDGESKLRIQGDRVDLSGATMILDQMDEYAVEEAIRLVRSAREPAFLHLEVVRLWGHAGSDAEQVYRSLDEIAATGWRRYSRSS